MPYCYKYPRPAVTVDIIVQSADKKILFIKRKKPPFQSQWALPGGFLDLNETPETAALRELEEETGLKDITIKQFRTYGDIDRDPRHRTISIVFYGFCNASEIVIPKSGDDASDAQWFSINEFPKLAFDHQLIMNEFLIEIHK